MKPIFEAGFFYRFNGDLQIGQIAKVLEQKCNERLSSLGIDAETPEKLKRLEKALDLSTKLCNQLETRLAELEKRLELFEQVVSYKTVESLLAKDLRRLAELEKMIAEAPEYFALTVALEKAKSRNDLGDSTDVPIYSYPHVDQRSELTRLIDIREIERGEA